MIINPEMTLTINQSDRTSIRKWLMYGLAAYLTGVITGVGYFTIGGVFALLSDLASVAMGLTMIPVVLGLAKIFARKKPETAKTFRILGLTGFALLTTGGGILSFFYFFQVLPGGFGLGLQFIGIFLQGIWLILTGVLAIQTGAFSRKAAWAGIIAGAGYFVIGASSAIQFNPVSMLASGAAVVGYILWTLWTRSDLKTEQKSRGGI
jgi:hypothetical protein